MTRKLDTRGDSPTEVRRRRVFRARLWAGVGCYLLASLALSRWGHSTNPWRLVWAILPLLCMAWVVLVIALRVRQLDEYQAKLLVPGLAVGFTVTIFAALTVGTLDSAGFPVPNAGWPVALIGLVAWEITNLLVRPPSLMDNLIRSEREQRGWTQSVLAERLEVSRQTVVALETGKYDPSLPLAFRISQLFEKPIEALFTPANTH